MASSLPKSAAVTIPELWVAVAAAPSGSLQKYKRLLHAEGGILYGFNGYRLHWIPTTLADGSYDPKTFEPVDFGGWRPDWPTKLLERLSALSNDDHIDDLEIEFEGIPDLERVRTTDGGLFDAQYVGDGVNGDLYPTFKSGKLKGRHILYGENELGGAYLIQGIEES